MAGIADVEVDEDQGVYVDPRAATVHAGVAILATADLWLDPSKGTTPTKVANLGTGGSVLDGAWVTPDDPVWLGFADNKKYLFVPNPYQNSASATPPTVQGVSPDVEVDLELSRGSWALVTADWLLSHIPADDMANYCWDVFVDAGSLLTFRMYPGGDAFDSSHFATWDVSALPVDTKIWLRITWDHVSQLAKAWWSTDKTTWTAIGTPQTIVLAAVHTSATAAFTFGNSTTHHFSFEVHDGIGGPVVGSFDASLCSATGGTMPTGEVWSFTRAYPGLATCLVERGTLLVAANHIKVLNHALLNFPANQDFTFTACRRRWTKIPGGQVDNGTWLTKGGYGAAGSWSIQETINPRIRGQIVSSAGTFTPPVVTSTLGAIETCTIRRKAGEVRMFVNGTDRNSAGGTVITPDVTNISDLHFGGGGGFSGPDSGANCAENFGMAMWRKALTDTEIATVSDFYITKAPIDPPPDPPPTGPLHWDGRCAVKVEGNVATLLGTGLGTIDWGDGTTDATTTHTYAPGPARMLNIISIPATNDRIAALEWDAGRCVRITSCT